jgi:hypothetical protein
MCAALKDAHTNVYADAKELGDQIYSGPLIRTRLIEDKVLVVRVYDEALRKDGFEPGVEVLKVDDIPVRQYAEERVAPYVSAATNQDLEVREFDYELLQGSKAAPVKLTLQDAKGNVFERTLARLTPEEQSKFFARTSRPAPLHLKVPEGNIGYGLVRRSETGQRVRRHLPRNRKDERPHPRPKPFIGLKLASSAEMVTLQI